MKNKNKNKGGFLFLILIPLVLAGFFGFAKISNAESSIIISAVQIRGASPDDDFIEFYNTTCADVSLANWKLKKKTKDSSTASSIGTLKNTIPAKGYYLWENTSKNLSDNPDYSTKTYYLSSDYSVALFDSAEKQIDSLTWGSNLNPFSPTLLYATNPIVSQAIKRDVNNNLSLKDNYIPKNSSFIESDELAKCPKEEPKIYSTKIEISEIYPHPSDAANQDEFVELFNSGDEPEKLAGWRLEDRVGKKCDLAGKEIGARSFLLIKKDLENKCDLALNDTGGEILYLYNPRDKIPAFSVEYAGSAKKGLSYGFDNSSWRWSKFLTPGKENKFNNLPEVNKKKDNKIYVNMYADFSAKGSDKDGDKLKFVWDFGDGHKSYLKKTRHKYEKTGKYKVTLKVSDGSEDKIETFSVKVEKFPKSKVKILSVSPNPKGKDSDSEFITLQNKSKKEINLKDWSVATGSKNLYNHPVSKEIFIKPGKILKLTRDYSKFALNNKKAKVELRYPNGKVASKLAYDKKKESVAEDELYTKESGQWSWVAPKTETKLALEAKSLEVANFVAVEKEVPREPEIILASGQNFSEDENLRKSALENFSKPQGIILGAATFKPAISGTYPIQNKISYLETIFTCLNSVANYFLNKFFLKFAL